MLRDDVGGSEEAAGIHFVSLCQSALRECSRQEKAVALPMLLTLRATIQVKPQVCSVHHMQGRYAACATSVSIYVLETQILANSADAGSRATSGPR